MPYWELGYQGGKNSTRGTISGSVDGVPYRTEYSLNSRECFGYLDVLINYCLSKPISKNKIYIGAGPSLAVAFVDYPYETTINHGVVESEIRDKKSTLLGMATLAITDHLTLNESFYLLGRIQFRTSPFSTARIETTTYTYHENGRGIGQTRSSVVGMASVQLGIGHHF